MKLEDVQAGDVLIADDGFTCLRDGEECVVRQSEDGALFVFCAGPFESDEDLWSTTRDERHALDGQVDDESGEMVGFTRKAA